jgi:AraC-like DNA-binding protein
MQTFDARRHLDGPETLPAVDQFLNRLPVPRDERESALLEGFVSRLRQRCATGGARACALRAASYVRAHFADSLRLDDLARTVGTAPRTLRRSFKEEFGLSIREFQIRVRVREALRRVAAGEKVSVGALATGYRSEEHLCRAVRRVAGIAPTAVRDLDPATLQSVLAALIDLSGSLQPSRFRLRT